MSLNIFIIAVLKTLYAKSNIKAYLEKIFIYFSFLLVWITLFHFLVFLIFVVENGIC